MLAFVLATVFATPVPEPAAHAAIDPVVTSDDRAAAATTAGVGAFVGTILGGVIVPGAAGLIGGAIGERPAQKDLVDFSTIGGAAGAAIGSTLGALPTADPWYGPPIIGGAGAVGALVGLLPSLYFGKQTPKTDDPNDPTRLAQSGCLLLALVAAPAAAAGTGALLAAPGAGR